MMLRKKLRNKTILMRMARLEGLEVWRVLYISMINDATMEENKLFCKAIGKRLRCEREICDARRLSPAKPLS